MCINVHDDFTSLHAVALCTAVRDSASEQQLYPLTHMQTFAAEFHAVIRFPCPDNRHPALIKLWV